MKTIKIEGSSNIDEIGYDEEKRTLTIKFHNGGLYEYTPFTLEGFKAFSESESKGKFFYKNIRYNSDITVQRIE